MNLEKNQNHNEIENLYGRSLKASALFLERRGMDVLEVEWACEAGEVAFIAEEEDGALCFIDLTVGDSSVPMPDSLTKERRSVLEAVAMSYLAQAGRGHVNREVRFDALHVRAVNNDSALIKYHLNVAA